MTARKVNVLTCDAEGCREQIAARDAEAALELRVRAARENGWRSTPSLAQGGHTDLCRWHA